MKISFKVFIIGLSKTGTTSMAAALSMLNYKVKDYNFTQINKIANKSFTKGDLKNIDAAGDITVVSCYKMLDAMFPGSKFILTYREMNSWLKSAEFNFTKEIMKKYKNTPENIIFNAVYGCSYFNKEAFT